MKSRHSRPHALLAAVALSAAAVACQKVPLLAPSGSTITLTSLATALPANGTTDIIAQVIEPAGTPPHAGTHVTFSTTLGSVQPAEAETDINGQARVKFLAGSSSGTATITAISGGVSTGSTGAIKIAIGTAAVSGLVMSAAPMSLPASGGSSTISAKVVDAGGNPLPGVLVTFTTDAGTLSPSVSDTDFTGVARTTLTSSRTAKVTATAGVSSTSGTSTSAQPTASVTVTVNLTPTISIGTPSPAIPGVGQPVSLPLTYSGTGAGPLARVNLSWGDGATQTFTGQPSVVSHTYSAVGTYLVSITGVDTFGDTTTTSASITVTNSKPSVGITTTNDNPLVNTSVTFNVSATIPGSPTGVAIQSVHVDFGDGKSADLGATATSVNHTYTTTGEKSVVATATATNGQTGSATMVVTVKLP